MGRGMSDDELRLDVAVAVEVARVMSGLMLAFEWCMKKFSLLLGR